MAKVLRADMSPKAMEEFARGGKTGNEYKKKQQSGLMTAKLAAWRRCVRCLAVIVGS